MIEIIKSPVKKQYRFWKGWRIEAAKKFDVSVHTLYNRLKRGEPDLVEWLDIEMKRRKKAKVTKLKFEKNTDTD